MVNLRPVLLGHGAMVAGAHRSFQWISGELDSLLLRHCGVGFSPCLSGRVGIQVGLPIALKGNELGVAFRTLGLCFDLTPVLGSVLAADTSGSGKLPHLTICLALKHGLLSYSIGTASFNLKKKRDQIKSI